MTVVKNSCCVIAEAARAYIRAVAALKGTDSAAMTSHQIEESRCFAALVEAVDPDLLATFGADE